MGLLAAAVGMTGAAAQPQNKPQASISYIESTGSWYYIYDQSGRKTKTLSSSIGELQGYSASFFIVKSGSWYYIYDASGRKRSTMSVSTVGEIVSVAGETFTSRSGSWLYTWDMSGKKKSTRSAPR